MNRAILVLAACVALAGCAWLREPIEPTGPPPPAVPVTDSHGRPILTATGEPMVVTVPRSEAPETRGQYVGRALQENGSRFGGPIGLGVWLLGGLLAGGSVPVPASSTSPAKKEEKDGVA